MGCSSGTTAPCLAAGAGAAVVGSVSMVRLYSLRCCGWETWGRDARVRLESAGQGRAVARKACTYPDAKEEEDKEPADHPGE